ncbi:hypothetical protein CNR22_06495 [Sphingobacteriaceae bacterium]|nr:hypothetical protein CNR22_06495 [Sphingobacteriaceae bacterium]
MNKKKFKLSAKVNIPCHIEIKNPETETHGLLRLSNGDFCDFLNLTFTGNGTDRTEKIEAKTFLQMDLKHQTGISVNAEFLDEAGFVEGEFYTGSWEEIVLREIELSLTDEPFFYSCDSESLKFSIGAAGESHLQVEAHEDDKLSIVFSVKNSTDKIQTVTQSFSKSSDGGEMIKRLYGRLRNLARDTDFIERQTRDKKQLIEQFNKTMSESFRF